MAVDLRAIIEYLEKIHFYDVFLPFILIYAIVFAVLEKSGIFSAKGAEGSQVKNVNSIIAFVFGLFAVASIQTVKYIQSLIVGIVLFLVFILVVLIVLGFIFGEEYLQLFMKKEGEKWVVESWAKWAIGGVVLIVALIVLINVTGAYDALASWWQSTGIGGEDIWTVIVIVAIGLVLYFISKGEGKSKSSS